MSGEGVELVHEALGVHPAQRMAPHQELARIVADDHRVGQQPVRLDGTQIPAPPVSEFLTLTDDDDGKLFRVRVLNTGEEADRALSLLQPGGPPAQVPVLCRPGPSGQLSTLAA